MTSDPRLALLRDLVPSQAALNLLARFDTTEVVIETDRPHAMLALSIANLAARLWPHVRLIGSSAPVASVVFGSGPLIRVAEQLVVAAGLGSNGTSSRRLVVAAGGGANQADVFVTADAWSVRLSTSPGASLSGEPGPATTAAAALAVAELFRRLLPELPGHRLTADTFSWNLVDYSLSPAPTRPDTRAAEVTCFGAGSVGSSFVLALLVADADGVIDLVDDDRLQPRNRLRYPLWIGPQQGPKVDWIAAVTASGRLRVRPHEESARAYIDRLNTPPRLAIAAVDTPEARRDVADALSRETLNAGVDGLRFHVSRHRFADGFACVYCPYLDVRPSMSQVEVYVGLTGLGSERVAQLLGGGRLTDTDIDVMVSAGRLAAADSFELGGGRLQDVARARLYAATPVPGLDGVAISAPFVSALAGAILAAEALKTNQPNLVLDRRVDADLSGWPTGLTSRPLQDATGRCLCRSRFRQRAYEQAWAGPNWTAGGAAPDPEKTS